jgi:hypothetical protein
MTSSKKLSPRPAGPASSTKTVVYRGIKIKPLLTAGRSAKAEALKNALMEKVKIKTAKSTAVKANLAKGNKKPAASVTQRARQIRAA